MKSLTKIVRTLISLAIILVVTFILVEASSAFLLNNSSILRGNLREVFRQYYLKFDRKIIQLLPDCSRYDKEVGYTLKPGKFRINNRESSVEYHINSLGVRDDEFSLTKPEIIVTGDSHAMGWGVDQNLTYASLLEKKTGKKVLNSGISSYGTVRELKLLERVDGEKLAYLFIQYCNNDFRENKDFYNHKNSLQTMSKEKYQSEIDKHLEKSKYYFGKHSNYVRNILIKKIKMALKKQLGLETEKKIKRPLEEAVMFMNALLNSSIDLTNTTVVVFQINGYARDQHEFIDRFKDLLSKSSISKVKKIIPFDFSSILTPEHYFNLDDHINTRGHEKIADCLLNILDKEAN